MSNVVYLDDYRHTDRDKDHHKIAVDREYIHHDFDVATFFENVAESTLGVYADE